MKIKISKQEKDILQSLGKGEWQPVANVKKVKQKYQKYALASLKKEKRINIRLSVQVLEGLQKKAYAEGLPYQTFISSLLHKFIHGRIVEKNI